MAGVLISWVAYVLAATPPFHPPEGTPGDLLDPLHVVPDALHECPPDLLTDLPQDSRIDAGRLTSHVSVYVLR